MAVVVAHAKIPPLRIVLSGGGIRAVGHAGALQALEKAGMLRTVREYIGVSAGALMALCMVIGYTPDTLVNFCLQFDFSTIRALDPENMLEFLDRFGIDNGDRLRCLLESILRQKNLAATTTFSDIRKALPAAARLRIFASDIFTVQPREFSEAVTPNVSVITALMASMCIPGYFVPVEDPITGHLLVDGGALHNFPLAFLSEKEQKTSLGITFSEDHVEVKSIQTFFDYLKQIYACFYIPRTYSIWDRNRERIIIVECGDYPMWDFEASQEVRKEMVEKGRHATEGYLLQRIAVTPQRRFSAA